MDRLLQGDVGSGKTVVALALLRAVEAASGRAHGPTEMLAEQHFLTRLVPPARRGPVLLTAGAPSAAQRARRSPRARRGSPSARMR